MKTSVEKLDGLLRKLTVEVPENLVKSAYNKLFADIKQKAVLKGFRKGKVPMDVVKREYHESVTEQVIEKLIQEGYRKALEEHSLDPIGQPHVHFDTLKDDKSFSFTAEVEIRPEIDLKQIENLPVEKEILEIDEESINGILTRVREGHPEFTPVFEDRATEAKDVVEVDFKGTMFGEVFEGGEASDFRLELGSNSMIPGFEEGIVGMKVNDSKTLQLKFPDEYHHTDFAGQPVDFEISLKKLLKKTLPELNDDLAKKLGGFETLDDLKKTIREEQEMREKQRVEGEFRQRVLKSLVQKNPIELPKKLHQIEINRLKQDTNEKLKREGYPENQLDEYHEKWQSDYETSASFMIQCSFLVDAIAEKYKLHATSQEISAEIKTYSKSPNADQEKIRETFSNPKEFQALGFRLTESKVVEFLISKSNIKEVQKAALTEPAN